MNEIQVTKKDIKYRMFFKAGEGKQIKWNQKHKRLKTRKIINGRERGKWN